MKVLVFGATGQVARALAHQSPEAICLSRADADLSGPAACAAAIAARAGEVEAVINAAAWTAVDAAEAHEAEARVINAEAPGAMALAAAEAGLPFCHVSTDYVFDGSGETPWRPDDPIGPLSAYGRTKLAGEAAVRAAGGRHAILRTSWVFAPEGANFVATMLRLSQTRDRLTVVADQVGGPTPAAGIAQALLTIAGALRDGAAGGTFHYAGAPDVSWADFARAIFAEAGREVTVEDIPSEGYPTPAPRPKNSRLDCSTTTSAFGLPRPDWRTAVREMV